MVKYLTHKEKGGRYEEMARVKVTNTICGDDDIQFEGTVAGKGSLTGCVFNVHSVKGNFYCILTDGDPTLLYNLTAALFLYRDAETGMQYLCTDANSRMFVPMIKRAKPITSYQFSLIAARDSERGIGYNNGLPWPKSDIDMQWFVDNTRGKVIVMGRKTWESIGSKPLPGRINIVLSSKPGAHQQDWKSPVLFMESIHELITWLETDPDPINCNDKIFTVTNEIMVIGGAKVYEAFAPYIRKLYLTTFNGKWAADTFLHIDLEGCKQIYKDHRRSDVHFEIYQKPAFIVPGYDYRYDPKY